MHSFFLAVEPFSVSDVISAITKLFTAAIGWVSTVASTIVSNPILLLFVVIPLIGLGVGLFKRLISIRS